MGIFDCYQVGLYPISFFLGLGGLFLFFKFFFGYAFSWLWSLWERGCLSASRMLAIVGTESLICS